MLKRVLVAASLIATATLALPQAANARPVECYHTWYHGHPVRHCRPAPWHRDHRHFHHRPPYHHYRY